MDTYNNLWQHIYMKNLSILISLLFLSPYLQAQADCAVICEEAKERYSTELSDVSFAYKEYSTRKIQASYYD